ncbi:unnamed protein product [Notodromas monacha]|uniref:Uncharacterized protein n=1 Tax=Notodromas monacha TaxID=399045 RepID=A0A7R9GA97_9CRUS|nr:unnamed protein product [Notodromas monacha]CAG0913878.1 unnamed protein product [Notodromas monacha]
MDIHHHQLADSALKEELNEVIARRTSSSSSSQMNPFSAPTTMTSNRNSTALHQRLSESNKSVEMRESPFSLPISPEGEKENNNVDPSDIENGNALPSQTGIRRWRRRRGDTTAGAEPEASQQHHQQQQQATSGGSLHGLVRFFSLKRRTNQQSTKFSSSPASSATEDTRKKRHLPSPAVAAASNNNPAYNPVGDSEVAEDVEEVEMLEDEALHHLDDDDDDDNNDEDDAESDDADDDELEAAARGKRRQSMLWSLYPNALQSALGQHPCIDVLSEPHGSMMIGVLPKICSLENIPKELEDLVQSHQGQVRNELAEAILAQDEKAVLQIILPNSNSGSSSETTAAAGGQPQQIPRVATKPNLNGTPGSSSSGPIENFELALTLLVASWNGQAGLVEELLSKCSLTHRQKMELLGCTDSLGRTGLHLAALSGSADTVKVLLAAGALVNAWDREQPVTPLCCAASVGSLDCVKILVEDGGALIECGSEPSSVSALYYAVLVNAVDCVKYLVSKKANVNFGPVFSDTPVHIAAAEGFVDCLKVLLDHGGNVVLKGTDGNTPLHLAATDGSYDTVNLLIRAGSDVNAGNSLGRTPLHLAALCQAADCVQALLKAAGDPNAPDADGKTPLHSAIVRAGSSRNCDCVKELMKFGADPNHRDSSGFTPLHLAVINEFSHCAYVLLDGGGDVTIKTNGGRSVLSYIVRKMPDALVKLKEMFNQSVTLTDNDDDDEEDDESNYGGRNKNITKSGFFGGIKHLAPNIRPNATRHEQRDVELHLNFKVLKPPCNVHEMSLFMGLIQCGQRRLLNHPLCESFLHLKWKKIRKFFLLNVLVYAVFVFSITAYVLQVFKERCLEASCVTDSNCTLECAEKNLGTPDERKAFVSTKSVNVSWYLMLVLAFVHLVKELFQVVQNIREYVRTIENAVQLGILALVMLLVNVYYKVQQKPALWENSESPEVTTSVEYDCAFPEWKYHVATWTTFLAWVELMFLIGRFPSYGLYIQMFIIVLKDFSQFFMAYSAIILAFSMSFSVIFPRHALFGNPWESILSTLVMMTGEWSLYIRYNDPRDKRLPKEIKEAAFKLATTTMLKRRKRRMQMNRDRARRERRSAIVMMNKPTSQLIFPRPGVAGDKNTLSLSKIYTVGKPSSGGRKSESHISKSQDANNRQSRISAQARAQRSSGGDVPTSAAEKRASYAKKLHSSAVDRSSIQLSGRTQLNMVGFPPRANASEDAAVVRIQNQMQPLIQELAQILANKSPPNVQPSEAPGVFLLYIPNQEPGGNVNIIRAQETPQNINSLSAPTSSAIADYYAMSSASSFTETGESN